MTRTRITALGLGLLLIVGTLDRRMPDRPAGPLLPGRPGPDGLSGFEENRGQFEGPARFVAFGRGFGLALEPAEAVMRLDGFGPDSKPAAVRMALVGGRQDARLLGRDARPGRTHYLHGADPGRAVRDVTTYASVVYEEVYPGIDLAFRGEGEGIEYDFLVAPGADPGRIRLAFDGIERARIDADGDLVLETRAGEVRQLRPRIYQESGAGRREVTGGFDLLGAREVGFRVGRYDPRRTLVIDPLVTYSTYHGGCRGRQGIQDVVFDAGGNAYVTGDYPWDCDRGPADAFVSKFSPWGVLLFRTTFGGQFSDVPRAIALDAAGNIYLTGSTTSTTCCRPFPVAGAFQATNAGGSDAFITKLDPTGRTILYSTFLGGTGEDMGSDIEVDADGRIYVTGRTTSTNFPMANAWQPARAGASDAFLAAFQPDGSALAFSTYLGGSGDEAAARLVLSPRGAVIAGTTSSADFPARSDDPGGPVQPTYGGGASDAFLATLSRAGSLLDATYLGGSGKDEAYGAAVGPDFVYLTGSTDSVDFPTANAFQPALSSPPDADAFLARISATAPALSYSTYVGVSKPVTCFSPLNGGMPCGGVGVDPAGNAYVTAQGAFVVKVDSDGVGRPYTVNGFGGQAIAVSAPQPAGTPEVLVSGRTASFLFPTVNAAQSNHDWIQTDIGWLAKLRDGLTPKATFEEDDPRIAYAGTWEAEASPLHSGGRALRSAEPGARATITFTGTGIQVVGRRDPAAGIVKVSASWNLIVQNAPLDTYASPAEARSLLVAFSGLAHGTYTLTLEVTGTRNSRSNGAWIGIDGINVPGAPPPSEAPPPDPSPSSPPTGDPPRVSPRARSHAAIQP